MEKITARLGVLYPNMVSSTLLSELMRNYIPVGAKIYDFEIYAISLTHGVINVATFNKKDYTGIKVLTYIKKAIG